MGETAGDDLVRSLFGIGADLPLADAVITSGRKEVFAIGAEDDAGLLLRGLRKCVEPLTSWDAPELNGAVGAGAREHLAIWTE